MAKITATAESLLHGFSLFSLPLASEPLFKVLALEIDPTERKVRNTVQSENKASFMHGVINHWQIEGEASKIVVDAEELLKFLGAFGPKDVVSIDFGETIVLKSSRKRAVIYPEALTPLIPESLPKVKEGVAHYRVKPGVEEFVPAETRATVPTDAFREFINDSKLIYDTPAKSIFPLRFEPNSENAKGSIRAALGSEQSKHNIVETTVETEVTGVPIEIKLSKDFINIFHNVDKHCSIQLTANKPVVILVEQESYKLLYVTAPLREG